MLVQRTFFAPPNDLEPGELYTATERGTAVAERVCVTVAPHTRISTNTYFGRFPASYWQRWTPVGRVRVHATARGSGQVRLMASDTSGDARAVDSVRIATAGSERIRLRAELNRFTDGGALWLQADTQTEELVISDVRWEVDDRPRERPAVIVICTYNRADDCVATLTALVSDAECVAGLEAIYVIDQGNDPVSARVGFAKVRTALGDKLRYLRQPNLGGAGGFTRGMYEATSGVPDNWPYVVLMDDDIMLEPDSVLRMIAFAARTEQPALVGGQMLQLLHPYRLHVSAEHADLRRLRAGRPVTGAVHDADLTSTTLDIRVDAEYNAWWSCLIPPEVVAAIGYPMPLFFQWDDVEYGLRARTAGYPTVTLPGAGVWHADFAWKDWDDWSRYFSLRNALIVSAVHGEFDLPRTASVLCTELWRYLVSMRYGLARTLLMAVEDFLRGPPVLADGGAQAAAAVRKVRADHRETVVHPAFGAPQFPVAEPDPEPAKPGLVLGKRVVWQVLGRSRGQVTIAARHNHWWHVSRFDTAVVTDPSQEGVRLRRRDPVLLRKLGWRGMLVLAQFCRHAIRAARQYRAALPELTSRSNWARLFDADSSAG